ncbi:uncharacterized protein LOC111360014 [Spodoptera litura]|uniref:Uncharacterized protein LOC111356236 n=1 Tax=Spodoptera litura TaxID=69820 RepID=A0A9J7ECR0_SPOLT|nr:uncharacterized protein LOC111356236 [Spodoptera litura]XP_022831563.1 uncharacterized protein LOC111360014 [Spodoptera litura]
MQTDSSGDDLSDSEILNKCEEQLNQMNNMDEQILTSEGGNKQVVRSAEKRKEREDTNSEDDFITVVRGKPKRLLRSNSLEVNDSQGKNKENDGTFKIPANHEVCVTAKENLPKPIAFAKLLRCENIKDILRIKYKSANKVLIQCQRKEDALKLIECKKFKEMGLRCQLTQEMSVSYGIVKGIDLELSEEELMDIFKSSVDVLSAKRLKRLLPEGKWVDCESVRLCFKSNVLPEYIYAYDCRFKVEKYVFPVTQCSGCWQFGHLIKFCPTKKVVCPKCGGTHDNCNITNFKCLNCKGNHFVLNKKCPMYLKERSIRNIMSEENVTYRKALQILKTKKGEEITEVISQENNDNQFEIVNNNEKETYSNVLTRALIHHESVSNREEERRDDTGTDKQQNIRSSKQKTNKQNNYQYQNKKPIEQPIIKEISDKQEEKRSNKHSSQWLDLFEWTKIWTKIKNICKSKLKLEEKAMSLLKLIGEELKNFLINILFGEDILGYIQCFNNE